MMKQTHGILIWVVVLLAVFPVADGMVSGVSHDCMPTQSYWVDNLVAIVMVVMIILGTACVFNEETT